MSRSLPSLRDTLASPTLPHPSLQRQHNAPVSAPPAGPPSSAGATSKTPWLYAGEEPEYEEEDGPGVSGDGDAERPKKRRRTRVALSCAGQFLFSALIIFLLEVFFFFDIQNVNGGKSSVIVLSRVHPVLGEEIKVTANGQLRKPSQSLRFFELLDGITHTSLIALFL